jgi:predicted Rossmann-fold nucleotide-binding protein
MEQRKKKFLSISDSFIALPGGAGTIEEISLVLSALQLGVIKNKKFIIFNYKNYWSDIIKQYKKVINSGFAYKNFNNLFVICSNFSELKDSFKPVSKILTN